MKLDNTIAAIVTGAASGLGEATARHLASFGVRVGVLDLNEERGQRVAAEIGGMFALCDVTDDASVIAALENVRAKHGVERILVNCAGIVAGKRTVSKDRETGALLAHDLGSFAKVIGINLIGSYRMIANCAVAMAGLEPVTRRWRARRDREYRFRRGRGRADRAGGLFGIERRHCRPDLAGRARSLRPRHPRDVDHARHFPYADVRPDFRRIPQIAGEQVPFPQRFGNPAGIREPGRDDLPQ